MIQYLYLARFHQPIGIVLLWAPIAWSLWIAAHGFPELRLVALFFFGTLLMRAAGCVINDIVDRNIDCHVARTKHRPLASGKISLMGAFGFLLLLLCGSVLILIQLPAKCFVYALVGLGITIIYPFCKRFLHCPQLVLGFAFSMGIPMVYAATGAVFDYKTIMLWVINFLWIIAYDTQYAILDRIDDICIGVRSTAVLFKSWTPNIIILLQFCFHGAWLILAWWLKFNWYFLFEWFTGLIILIYQQQPEKRMRIFLSNGLYGICMWIAVFFGERW
ncbi:MAG: hypothetical protein A3F46_00325 [Legionellales bacterium RIFCSPHIGHO2_12_FULL_42_9]|nr:MAG: hypothetical protein A3F46_00325 [Legionellales bacterium RIFCSPHIGHO2_12_FULL_42_9]